MADTPHRTLEPRHPLADLALSAADLLAGRVPPDDAIVLLDRLVSGVDGTEAADEEPADDSLWHAPWVVVQVWPNRWVVRSAAFSRVLGHAPEIARRHGPLAFVHPADRGAALRAYAEITTGRRARRAVPIRVGAADGGLRLLETTFTRAGRVDGARSVVVYARDRTGPHADHVRLRAVVSLLDHGVMVVDGSGCVRLVNEVLTRMFGNLGRDCGGRHEEDVLRGLASACGLAVLPRAPRHLRLRLADGRLVDADRTPVADAGTPLGAIWRFREVPSDGETVHLTQEAVARPLEVAGALAGVSRDLDAIARLAGVFSGDTRRVGRKDWRVAAGAIARDARRVLRVVDDLATLSSLDSGTFSLRYGQVDVPELVRSVLEDRRAEAYAAGVALVCRVGSGPALVGDAERLRQALGRLVGDAVRFGPRNGKVTVHAQHKGQCWLLTVADRGTGVPGRGPGLATCRRLVELHRGELTTESRIDAGTTVRVTIPVDTRGR